MGERWEKLITGGFRGLIIFFWYGAGWFFLTPSHALEPHEILVLSNKSAAHSVGLGKYYIKKRSIPEDNLLQLRVVDKEWCSREDYDKKVADPVREYFKHKDPERRIRCLLVMSFMTVPFI